MKQTTASMKGGIRLSFFLVNFPVVQIIKAQHTEGYSTKATKKCPLQYEKSDKALKTKLNQLRNFTDVFEPVFIAPSPTLSAFI